MGFRANGQPLASEVIGRQFVAGRGVTLVVVAIVALVILFRVASHLLARRAGSKRAAYGDPGGAVCPNCGRAFGIHWWRLQLGFGRLDRCPQCKKWHMVNRAPAEALAAAEARHSDQSGSKRAGRDDDEDEAFRRRLEESRYDQT
jgi:hypothetical protein